MKDRKRKRNAPTSPIPEPLDEPEDHNLIRLVHFAPTPQIIETSKGLEEQGGKEEQCTTTEVDNNISKNPPSNTNDVQFDFDPFDEKHDIEMCDEINNELAEEHTEATKMSGSRVTDIRAHRWKAGQLELEVHWDTENVSWESFQDLKLDHPNMTAQYIVDNSVSRSKRLDRVMQ